MECTGQDQKTGLLLYGPPGCSKTLVAKALATEADFNFIAVQGPELLNMYVGESERAVREVFRKARNASPSIIFFDEIDALGASRDTSHGGLHVLTTLLNELDGIEDLKGVVVLAATNNPAILDPALIRAGRFSTLFYIGLPDLDTRMKILDIRLRKVSHTDDINVPQLARAMEGFSGAEIVNICQKAGKAATKSWLESGKKPAKPNVTMEQLMKAIVVTEKGVSAEQLQEYEAWRASRR
jgi:AAA family ATPase